MTIATQEYYSTSQMQKAPKLIYILRKSKQDEGSVPVLKRDDFPLRFYFKGMEVNVAVTTKGNIEITKHRLTGAHVEQA